MKDEEKKLIENLFDRLKSTELNSSERDQSADELIQKLVKKQPASSYYMAQTILVQETHIKEMHQTIEELKKKIEKLLRREDLNKKPSFLSNFFKTNSKQEKIPTNNNVWKKKENFSPHNSHVVMSDSIAQNLPPAATTRSTGFLSNALQTATGVAGGMILGNMLMNVFNHSKTEEETFDTINKSSLDHHNDDNVLDSSGYNNSLVDYEEKESNYHTKESNLDNAHNDRGDDEFQNVDYLDDHDMNDDNFI